MRYPIYFNYDPSLLVGFVDIDEGTHEETLQEGAIVPKLSREDGETSFKLVSFGLVHRTTVDTRPRDL